MKGPFGAIKKISEKNEKFEQSQCRKKGESLEVSKKRFGMAIKFRKNSEITF